MTQALVTGGAGGIGLAIVEKLADAGMSVITCDTDVEGLERLRARHPGVQTLACDVSKMADVDQLFGALASDPAGLDMLVANVGIGGPTSPAHELGMDEWQRVIDVNLTGTFDVVRRAIPFIKASGGAIVIMSSAAGRYGYPNRLPYAVTKWGLVGMAKTLSTELGEYGVSVNAILPGAVGGDRFDRVIEGRAALSGRSIADETQVALANQSLKQVVDPSHVADLVHFLSTPAGRSVSGAALSIDCDLQRG